ncbi:MAG: tetratricopeptide repeat protein [Planctomycetales bacterium]|nr:tetratricopeptide repeat protein [Planctomycetales bacterium]
MKTERKPIRRLPFGLVIVWAWLQAASLFAQSGQELPDKNVSQQAEAIKTQQLAIGKQATKDFSQDFHAWRILGFVYSSHGHQDEMVECWRMALPLAPEPTEILDQLAKQAAKVEQHQQAVEYWQQILSADKTVPLLYRNLAASQLVLGQVDDAIRALEMQIKQTPEDAETLYLLGNARFELQDFAKAKEYYQQTLQQQPDHASATYAMVRTAARLGDTEAAAEYAAQFQKLEAAAQEADLKVRQQYDDLAQVKVRAAVTCVEAAALYRQHDRPDVAVKLLLRAIELDAANSQAIQQAADLYLDQQKFPEALTLMQRVVQLQPTLEGFYQLGMLQARLKKYVDAENSFRKMVKLAPKEALGYRALAKFYLNTNQKLPLALQTAAASAKLDRSAESLFVWGWALAKNGRLLDALAALEKAVQLEPENKVYRELLASVRKTIASQPGAGSP